MKPTSVMLESIGIIMPSNFNKVAYDLINNRLSLYMYRHPKEWKSFASAWSGMAYRTRTAIESSKIFTDSVSISNSPLPEERFQQEQALFNFFTNALSSLECFFYAAYCFASILKPNKFQMDTAKNLRVFPNQIYEKYSAEFPTDKLTMEMKTCLCSPEYTAMVDFRNMLAHRGAIPRKFYRGGNEDGTATIPSNPVDLSTDWQYNLRIDQNTTRFFEAWYDQKSSTLLLAAFEFCDSHL